MKNNGLGRYNLVMGIGGGNSIKLIVHAYFCVCVG
jgi:hypothetical protein